MTRLRCTVPFADGEALVGHASRLAACNGVGLVAFCRDMGIPLRGVVRGERMAVERLAELSGGEPDALATGAIGYVSHTAHRVRGQELHKYGLRRRSLVACPRCLAEDVAAGGPPPVELARARVAWNVRGIETCPIHRTALRTIEGDREDDGAHDFSGRLAPHLGYLGRMADEAPERAPTGFEAYLSDRLEHGTRSDGLLDAMPFHAARVACLRMGVLVAHGKRAGPRDLAPDQLREAEAAGFEAVRDGEPGFHRALDAFHSRIHAGRGCMEGPQAVLGTFWGWLARVGDDPAYGALSSAAAAYAFENYPYAAGAKVLGRTLERRRWHSLRSASLEAGLSPNRIRRLLTGTGLLPDDEGRTDALVLFDAERAAPFLAASGGTLQLPDVAVRLGVDREAVARLVQDGLLGTSPQPRARTSRYAQFEPGDVDRLVERLLDGAEEIAGGGEDALGLAACATRLRFARGDVLRLALDDRTLWRGRLAERDGASALVLRPEEVEARLSPMPGGLLDILAVARRLAVNIAVAHLLLRKELIRSRMAPRSRYGRPARVAEGADVEAFASEYASPGMLALETGRPVTRIRHAIAMARVAPAFPVEDLRGEFYRRSDLPDTADGGPELEATAMPLVELAKALRVSVRVAANILDAGLLPSWKAPALGSGSPTRFVLRADLEAFVGEHAPLSMLARERSTNLASMRFGLEDAGVEPVLATDGLRDPVYRRCDVPDGAIAPGRGFVPLSQAKGKDGSGLGRRTVGALVERGLVAAREVPGTIGEATTRAVAEADLDGFASLAAIARECDRSIDAVARWLRSEGVAPVIEGDALGGWVYRLADVPPSRDGIDAAARVLSRTAIVRRLGLEAKMVSALIRCGAIPLHETPRTMRGKPVLAVLQGDVDAFAQVFVHLGALARERGSTIHATRVWLELAGVEAAFPRDVCEALVYRRADVPAGGPADAADPPLDFRDVVRALGTTHAVVSQLLDAGTIPSRLVPRPASRTRHRIVPTSALRAFTDEYATLSMLARETGASLHEVRHRLAAHDVEPAFPRADVDVQLYRRSEIATRGALEGRATAAVEPKDVARELGMDPRSVRAVLEAGLMPSLPVDRPASGKPSRIVARGDLDRFKAEYATAGMLAKERGVAAPSLGRHLSTLGVEPVLPGSARCAAVYRRRDLPLLDGWRA